MAVMVGAALPDVRAATDASSQPGTITTVAGSNAPGTSTSYGFSGDGGPATSAQLYQPRAIAFDSDGNAYIADGLNHRIRRIDPAGTITTVAGVGTAGYAGDNGPALKAQMNTPHGVAVDAAGNLYIADSSNHRIRRVDKDGIITTVVGTGKAGATGEGGPATQALIKHPKTMLVDGAGNLWFADTGNNRICRVNLDKGILTTVAGNIQAGFEGDGGPADRALLNTPNAMWVAPDGVVYIADSDNHRVRKVDTSGTITTVAGTGQPASSGDGGPAGAAQLNDPRGLIGDADGNLYVGEEVGQRIRKIDASGTITTIAGTGAAGYSGDGGPATEAQVNQIRGLALDAKGNLWAADLSNNRIRVVFGVARAGAAAPAPSPSPGPSPGPSPAPSPSPSGSASPAPAPSRTGYWALGRDGRVYPFGDATDRGGATDRLGGANAVHLEPTPSAEGYWILDDRGNVATAGDATALGNLEPSQLTGNEKPTSLSATPTGRGYWIFTTKGRVFPFGDAVHHGDMGAVKLNGPVQSSVATPSGRGYYMVASDGGVFTFGDAKFHGSMGNVRLNEPVRSLVPDGDGVGYWLVASDGGIFSFEAPFRGSMGGKPLNKPVVGMVRYGTGYLMVAADGGIFNFSDRPFSGSLGNNPPEHPVVAVATLDTRRAAPR
jgi:sugar lactone lactonase YvrE